MENRRIIGNMNKKLIASTAVIAILLIATCASYIAIKNNNMMEESFAGGNGSEGAPYEITNADELMLLCKLINNEDEETYNKYCGANYVLLSDIDLGNYEWTSIGYVNHSALGSDEDEVNGNSFRGKFDGNGKTITNVSITIKDAKFAMPLGLGLFGHISHGASIKDLSVGINIDSDILEIGYVGGLVGFARDSVIENINISCKQKIQGVGDSAFVASGGLVGLSMRNTIEKCSVENIANATSIEWNCIFRLGGLIGDNKYSSIQMSSVNGSVISELDKPNALSAGGFLGESAYSNVYKCYSIVNLKDVTAIFADTGESRRHLQGTGGFVGACYQDKYKTCYAVGEVTGIAPIGGFVGFIIESPLDKAIIKNYFENCFYEEKREESTELATFLSEDTQTNLFKMTNQEMRMDGFLKKLNKNDEDQIWAQDNGRNNGLPYLVSGGN